MTLSIEEIELHLEERPHDLTVWREWLAYTRRHDIPHDRYIAYLRKEGFLNKDIQESLWIIERGNNLEFLRGVISEEPELISIFGPGLYSTQGIEDFIAPNLTKLVMQEVDSLELTKGFPNIAIFDSTINLSDAADLSNLYSLSIDNTSITNLDKLYEAVNLTKIIVRQCKLDIQISRFKKLRSLAGNPNILKDMGDSDTVERIFTTNSLHTLKNKGWYPNLEYPFKGINKQ